MTQEKTRRGRRPGPRIRSFKPEAFNHEKMGRLSDRARTLFFGLISMSDDEGRFRALLPGIAGHVFPYDDLSPAAIRRALQEVEANRTILLYEVDGVPYGAFRNWRKHQAVSHPTPSTLPPPPDPEIVEANAPNAPDFLRDSSGGSPEESRNASGTDVVPPRAGAVPVPVPGLAVDAGGTSAEVARARAHEGPADDIERVWKHYLDRVYDGRGGMPVLDDVRRKVIARALRLRPLDVVLAAIDGFAASDFHMGRGQHRGRRPWRDISYALRSRDRGKSDSTVIDEWAEAGRGQAAAQRARSDTASRFAGAEDYEEVA